MKLKFNSILFLGLLQMLIFCISSFSAYALDAIIRPYQSVRSAGMGGVRMTTGLYDENFFNNPARVTSNPTTKFTLLQLTPAELNKNTIKNISSLSKSNNKLQTVSQSTGENIYNRTQLIFPAFYIAPNENRQYGLAFGIISSLQTNANLRKSYNLDLNGILDIGPALTYGRIFFSDESLAFGITTHLIYRAGISPNYSIINYIRGTPLTLQSIGGDGAMIDFDLGATYKVLTLSQFQISIGAATQNILGGKYANIKFHKIKNGSQPPIQTRSYGIGISANRKSLGAFNNAVIAIEITDINNNPNGSIYKLLHFGGETHLNLLGKFLSLRAGINQGYLAAGIGVDLHYFTFDIASYGEELALNTGQIEDRRYTINLGIHI